MPNVKTDTLSEAEQLMIEGRIDESKHIVERFLNEREASTSSHLKGLILKGRILICISLYEDALKLAKDILRTSQEIGDHSTEIDSLILMSEVLLKLGRLDESLKVVLDGENILKGMSQERLSALKKREAMLIHRKAMVYRHRNKLDQALEYFQQSLSLSQECDYKYLIALTLHNMGVVAHIKGKKDQALELYYQSLEINEQIRCKLTIASTLNNMAVIYDQKGDGNQALDYLQQSLVIHMESGNRQSYGNGLNNLGFFHLKKGNLDQAMSYFEQSLAIREEVGHDNDIASSLDNIGHVHQNRGEIEQALRCQLRALGLRQRYGNKQSIADSLYKLGKIHHMTGDLKGAFNYLEQSLNYRMELGNNRIIAETLFSLVRISIDRKEFDQAQSFLQHLGKIEKDEKNKVVTQPYRVAKALVLKTSNRVRDRGRAEILLKGILDDDIHDHEVAIIAMLNLCDLLLAELRVSCDPNILKEIKPVVESLFELAEQQNSYWLLAETYVLKSRLALLDLEPNKARLLLNQAQIYVDDRGLGLLAARISNDHDSLLDQLDKWDDLAQKNASLEERVEHSDLDELMLQIIRNRWSHISVSTEEPVFILLMAQHGQCLFSKVFSDVALDQDLVGAFLTAFEMFCDELFSQSFDRAKFGKYTLIMELEAPLILCYVFQGDSYSAQRRVKQLMKSLKNQHDIWGFLMRSINNHTILLNDETLLLENLVSDIIPEGTSI